MSFRLNLYESIGDCVSHVIVWLQLQHETKHLKKQNIPRESFAALKRSNCAVFDIDDTIIRSGTQDTLVDPKIKQLYDLLVKLKWDIFFVTARTKKKEIEQWTRQQLVGMGFHKFTGLFLMPEGFQMGPDNNFSFYKHLVRKSIVRHGYRIGINIGDNWNDLLLVPPYRYTSEPKAGTLNGNASERKMSEKDLFVKKMAFAQKSFFSESVFDSSRNIHSFKIIGSVKPICIFDLEYSAISIKLPVY